MKKVLIGLGVLVLVVVVAIGGIGYYVYSNLDTLVERAIETAGTDAVGSEVAVDRVEINLQAGDVSIFGFSVANPDGFSNGDMMRFDELSVDLDLSRISRELIRIDSIVARNPYVRYETAGGTSNLDTVSARFASDESEPAPESTSADVPDLSIGSIVVEGIQGSLSADMLPRDVDVSLGDIRLQNMEGTPQEIAEQVMGPIVSQLSRRAADALLASARDILGEDLGAQAEERLQQLEEQADERIDEVRDQIDEELGEGAADRLREGVGNLLNRN